MKYRCTITKEYDSEHFEHQLKAVRKEYEEKGYEEEVIEEIMKDEEEGFFGEDWARSEFTEDISNCNFKMEIEKIS